MNLAIWDGVGCIYSMLIDQLIAPLHYLQAMRRTYITYYVTECVTYNCNPWNPYNILQIFYVNVSEVVSIFDVF